MITARYDGWHENPLADASARCQVCGTPHGLVVVDEGGYRCADLAACEIVRRKWRTDP